MAAFTTFGFDEIEKQLLQRSEDAQRIGEKMLKAGAKILADAQRAELKNVFSGEYSVGTLADSITIDEVKNSKSGLAMYINVYPQGSQPHGTPSGGGRKKKGKISNAQVGFMLEYGNSKMTAQPWMTAAKAKSENAVHEAMRQAWEEG